MGGKIGVLLAVETEAVGSDALRGFVDNTAMQIAAMTPQFVNRDGVTEVSRAEQRKLFDAQLEEEGKPEAVRPKIIEGKLTKWMKEVCLLDQASVLDGDKTVDQVRAEVEKQISSTLGVKAFVRYERGEGLDAGPGGPDFAEEARRMAGQG
jgi:elongation factor Ts